MSQNTIVLLVAGAVALYFFTRTSAGTSGSPTTQAPVGIPPGVTVTDAEAEEIALLQQAARDMATSNPSAASYLNYAAADISQPYSITGGTVHQTTALIGLEGWRV